VTDLIAELIAVRHGQSRANVMFPAADAAGRLESGLAGRDADVELTGLGRRQAAAFGGYLAALPPDRRPEVIVTSPFRRARDTWAIAADASGLDWPEPSTDERLIDRAMGVLEMRTRAAVEAYHPAEARRLEELGPMAYRPPGGENFHDVAARLGSFLADAHRDHAGRRLLVVAHDSVVLVLRGVVEGLGLDGLAAVEAAHGSVRNASVSRFTAAGGGLTVAEYNAVGHLDAVTSGPDESADPAS
jgi:2,3-bisphosphoglycerate-dependent phosphoglycerate mutase